MSKSGQSILRGAREALAYLQGKDVRVRVTRILVPVQVDVKSIRRKTGLSQARFAQKFGFTLAALRDWEQKRRAPRGPSRALLTVIAKEPEAVLRALRAD